MQLLKTKNRKNKFSELSMNVCEIKVNQNIFLSSITSSDIPALMKWLADKEISEQMLAFPYPFDIEAAKKFLKFIVDKLVWAVRKPDKELIGIVGFSDTSKLISHTKGIVYFLAKPYWGKGIMTEAVKKLCEYGFKELNLVRIEAPIFAFNTASIRVVEKAGFKKEELMKKAYVKNGEYIDGIMYAITKQATSTQRGGVDLRVW